MKKKSSKLIVVVAIVVLLVISLFCIKSCSREDTENTETSVSENINEVIDVIEEDKKDETVIQEKDNSQSAAENIADVDNEPIKSNGKYSYWVNFVNADGSILQRGIYEYGKTPKYTGTTPAYYDGAYSYEFTGWDKDYSPVTFTQVYTAQYSKTVISTAETGCRHSVYDLQADGSWMCHDCHELLEGTDDAYFTVLCNDQPTTIVNLTMATVANTNGISKTDDEISYVNSGSSKNVVIRTNSYDTSLEVNAPNDTIKHFGKFGSNNIVSCAPHSFIEYGDGAVIEVKNGNVVIDSNRAIKRIHLSQENNVFDGISITLENGATLPEISRDPVTIDQNGTLVCTVNSKADNKTEYIWLTNDGVYDDVKVSESIDGVRSEVTGATSNAQEVAGEICNIYKTNYDGIVVVDENNKNVVQDTGVSSQEFKKVVLATVVADVWDGTADTAWYDNEDIKNSKEYTIVTAEELAGVAELVNNGTESFEGWTLKLGKDIDLYVENNEGVAIEWKQIGTSSEAYPVNPFKGTFDGQNHVVMNLYQWVYEDNGHTDGADAYGLFGSASNVTIKNLILSKFMMASETENVWDSCAFGALVGVAEGDCTFDNITLSDSYLCGYWMNCGGIVGGCTSGNFVFDHINVKSSNTLTTWMAYAEPNIQLGGIVGELDISSASHITIRNSEVSCKLLGPNDSSSNYQWFQYRSSGMLIGAFGDGGLWSEGSNVSAQTVSERLTCENVTVTYDTWNYQSFCEFHELGHGSYSSEDEWKTAMITSSNDTVYVRNDIPGVGGTVEIKVNDLSTHVHYDDETHNGKLMFNQLVGGGNVWGGGTTNHKVIDGVTVKFLYDASSEYAGSEFELTNNGNVWIFTKK